MSFTPNAVSPTANCNQWSPVVIEDLLVREFLNGENVQHLIPPTPTTASVSGGGGAENDGSGIPAANPAKQLREANKAFVRYLRGGGISWTASGTPSASAISASSMMTNASHIQSGTPISKSQYTPMSTHSKSPTPTSGGQQHHKAFPLQQQQQHGGGGGGGNLVPSYYNSNNNGAMTPSSAPTVPTSPANINGNVPMKSAPFPLSPNAVNTQHHSPKSVASKNNHLNMTTSVTKPTGHIFGKDELPVQYSTHMGKVVSECGRINVNFPSNIPNNTALCTGKRRPHDDLIRARIQSQDTVDPDLIFAQPRDDFPLDHIFRGYPKVLAALAESRGMSGDWIADTFTADEESKYKEDMGYTSMGLSQSNSSFFAGMM